MNSGITTPLLKVAAVENVALAGSQMPFRKARSSPPKKAVFSVNAIE
jgi:hypothetical protein